MSQDLSSVTAGKNGDESEDSQRVKPYLFEVLNRLKLIKTVFGNKQTYPDADYSDADPD